MRLAWLYIAVLSTSSFGQPNTYPYVLKTFAGTTALGDGGPATSALLNSPTAAVADSAGNLYILDSKNLRIRKVTADGKISTWAQINIYGTDMKLAADGSLYVAAQGQIIKVSPAGDSTVVAGTGYTGYSGDGGPATAALHPARERIEPDAVRQFHPPLRSRTTRRRRRPLDAGSLSWRPVRAFRPE